VDLSRALRSTATRILITIVIFLAASYFIVALINSGLESTREGIKDFYRQEVELLAAKAQSVSFTRRGDEELQRMLEGTLQSRMQISYAYITRDNRPILHTFDDAFPEQLLENNTRLSDAVTSTTVALGDTDIIEFARGVDNLVGFHKDLNRTLLHDTPKKPTRTDFYFDLFQEFQFHHLLSI